MKILDVSQIRQADSLTCQKQNINSEQLMERAALQFVNHFISDYQSNKVVKHIFCGKGNNGGDGLAIARMLHNLGHKVAVYLIYSEQYASDCAANLQKLKSLPQVPLQYLEDTHNLPQLSGIIIDALLGTGCQSEVSGIIAETIDYMNRQKCIRISVDVPSGLVSDSDSGNMIVKADRVYTFQQPKLAFLLPQNCTYIKRFEILDIKLDEGYLESIETNFYYLEKKDIRTIYKNREKFTHKGTYGHGWIIAGSKGKIGAAILASKAALRTGIGLLTAHTPNCGYTILQQSVPEAMCSWDEHLEYFSHIEEVKNAKHFAIGPGLGQSETTQDALYNFLLQNKNAGVWDADALNILGKHSDWLSLLPSGSILTPHPKEFERLVGTWTDDFEKLTLLQNFCKKYGIVTILKGAHTAICDNRGKIYFNSTGNSGMSTAGSGDVLTGMLLALRAQGYEPLQAALLGVYLHGLSGNIALDKQSKESLIASDIIDNIGKAFKNILAY